MRAPSAVEAGGWIGQARRGALRFMAERQPASAGLGPRRAVYGSAFAPPRAPSAAKAGGWRAQGTGRKSVPRRAPTMAERQPASAGLGQTGRYGSAFAGVLHPGQALGAAQGRAAPQGAPDRLRGSPPRRAWGPRRAVHGSAFAAPRAPSAAKAGGWRAQGTGRKSAPRRAPTRRRWTARLGGLGGSDGPFTARRSPAHA